MGRVHERKRWKSDPSAFMCKKRRNRKICTKSLAAPCHTCLYFTRKLNIRMKSSGETAFTGGAEGEKNSQAKGPDTVRNSGKR